MSLLTKPLSSTDSQSPAFQPLGSKSPVLQPENESGAALILVLSVLLISSVLALSAITLSKLIYQTSSVSTGRSEGLYVAEGAAARIQWYLIYDLTNNPNRELDQVEDDASVLGLGDDDEQSLERMLANGATHEMDYYGIPVKFKLKDMITDIDVSGTDAGDKILSNWGSRYEGLEEYEELSDFAECLRDYTDGDDNARLGGAEEADYELPALPRNGKLQYREELFWIKNSEKFIKPDGEGRLTDVTVVPPNGLYITNSSSKKSFFSATKQNFIDAGFTEDEAEQLLAAAAELQSDNTSLDETLDDDLLTQAKSKFSFKESGYYTFVITVGNYAKRTLYVSLKLSKKMDDDGNAYYEWRAF